VLAYFTSGGPRWPKRIVKSGSWTKKISRAHSETKRHPAAPGQSSACYADVAENRGTSQRAWCHDTVARETFSPFMADVRGAVNTRMFAPPIASSRFCRSVSTICGEAKSHRDHRVGERLETLRHYERDLATTDLEGGPGPRATLVNGVWSHQPS